MKRLGLVLSLALLGCGSVRNVAPQPRKDEAERKRENMLLEEFYGRPLDKDEIYRRRLKEENEEHKRQECEGAKCSPRLMPTDSARADTRDQGGAGLARPA